MSRHSSCLAGLLLFAVMALFPARSEAAQSLDTCVGFIDSVPATITTQGVWCLRHDLSTSITNGNAITIAANNVTIDCNGFKLGGLSAGYGTGTYGIVSNNNSNATVRNCIVRGFFTGIRLYFNDLATFAGFVVEDNRLDSNTSSGVVVRGTGSVIRRNQINDTGLSTAFPGYAKGIEAQGAVDVLDNTVSGVVPYPDAGTGSVTGISAYIASNSQVSGNRVRGLVHVGTAGYTYGISTSNDANGRLTLRDNDVVGDNHGNGLTCYIAGSRAKDNIVNGFVTANQGCVDAGGNSF